MADQPIPYPPSRPLERLHVHDGLMMNAERWRLAHHYHRQRQNIQYQALYQPGIIYGLGVKAIEPPQNSLLHYRSIDAQQHEKRWLEIQPGIALDIEGNPIIVDAETDRTYRIAIDAPDAGTRTVYVVVSYVDPETLEYQSNRLTVPERFRFDQKTTPPNDREVELCRIELAPGGVVLRMPRDVFAPDVNEVNLLHRVQAQARSQAHVRLGIIAPRSEANRYAYENCDYLVRSLPALYPNLQGELCIPEASSGRFINLTSRAQCEACDVLFAHAASLVHPAMQPQELDNLSHYLLQGGVLLVETPGKDTELKQQIQGLFADLQSQRVFESSMTSALIPAFSLWNKAGWQSPLPAEFCLQTSPFLFATSPILDGTPIQVQAAMGVILVQGNLSDAWGIRGDFNRNEIRMAQELGINFLYFGWRRRYLTQLMQ